FHGFILGQNSGFRHKRCTNLPLERARPGGIEERTMSQKKQRPYWIHKVKTVSTFPPAALFTKDAQTIARVMAGKKVSPKGIGSGTRMIQFFINRAGKGLSPARKKELQRAITILQERNRKHRGRYALGRK